MKMIKLLLLLFLLTGTLSAQEASSTSNAPGVTAEARGWRSQIRNPALDEDPLLPSQDRQEQERAIQQNRRDNEVRARLGLPQLPPPVPRPQINTEPMEKPTVEYIYKARVTNNGEKAIRKLVWEYVFFEPGTQKEVGRRRNESKVNIKPGKSSELVVRSISPPTGTIDASRAGKKPKDQYAEQVVIQSIEYSDGTVWQRDKN
jgi:hypothetical protein